MALKSAINAPPLDGTKKGTFVYQTIKDRWPQILTKVIDQVHRFHDMHTSTYREEGDKDIKAVIQELSQMKYEMQTDKTLRIINDNGENYDLWNDILCQLQNKMGEEGVTWYKTPWLFVECYLYRRIMGSFIKTSTLKEFDPFKEQKQDAFLERFIIFIRTCFKALARELPIIVKEEDENGKNISLMMQVCLWGNKCDLSLSCGNKIQNIASPLEQLNGLSEKILVNDIFKVIEVIGKTLVVILYSNTPKQIDIVLDNSGLEVFDDLLFADFLLLKKKVETVIFHGKSFPWFVSDVTNNDFFWLIDMLAQSHCNEVKELGTRWKEHIKAGKFQFCAHPFWTLPFDYSEMSKYAADLYENLSKSSLLIFKGDLHYRKLVGDRDWPLDVSFKEALRGFHPAPLVALRTLKAETQVGLSSVTIDFLKQQFKGDKCWMVTGDFAVVQFCNK
uniref:Sugar phosphate phosphatase n=1 Tax=Syphacia muris TaxID=451379 RepID=A0A0N5AQK0_9BILA